MTKKLKSQLENEVKRKAKLFKLKKMIKKCNDDKKKSSQIHTTLLMANSIDHTANKKGVHGSELEAILKKEYLRHKINKLKCEQKEGFYWNFLPYY